MMAITPFLKTINNNFYNGRKDGEKEDEKEEKVFNANLFTHICDLICKSFLKVGNLLKPCVGGTDST